MELLITSPEKESADELARRVAFARQLGHRDILLLFTAHNEANLTVAQRLGATPALFVTKLPVARQYRATYKLLVAPPQREFFESRIIDALLEPELQSRPDFFHHRNSGLHQVLIKLCQPSTKRRGKMILATTSSLLGATPHRQATLLGRMAQNARWCNKYGVPYRVVSGARTFFEQRDKACLDALQQLLTGLTKRR